MLRKFVTKYIILIKQIKQCILKVIKNENL